MQPLSAMASRISNAYSSFSNTMLRMHYSPVYEKALMPIIFAIATAGAYVGAWDSASCTE
jgi:hypothetical protein